jgi:pyruvate/2-oxoglutarate dehydrogenase complex dihydrolipoamide dehydrogenase (E3) component
MLAAASLKHGDDVKDHRAYRVLYWTRILRDDGITILTSSTPLRAEPACGGRRRLTVRTEDGERQIEGSHLLSAIGRRPLSVNQG